MKPTARAVMTLCQKCKTIQKAGVVCPNCRFPIPAKSDQEDDQLDTRQASWHLSRALLWIKNAVGKIE